MTKKAKDFMEEIALGVDWLESTAIVLKEKVAADNEANWAVTTGPLSSEPAKHLKDIIDDNQDLRLDWKGVEDEGDGMRTLVRWISV